MPVDLARRKEYQDRSTDAAVDGLRAGADVVLVSPTGSGKTVMGLETVKELQFAAAPGPWRTLVVQDRVAIAEQNMAAASRSRLADNALWTEGRNAAQGRTVFTTIDTALKPSSDLRGFNLLLIDEMHHAAAGTSGAPSTEYSRLVARMTAANPSLVVLGMSATEHRNDGQELHPRLAAARRIRVTHHEALGAGAIVPVRTIAPEWRLESKGRPTVREAIQPFLGADATQRDAGIRAMMQRHRPPDFLEFAVDQAARHAGGLPAFAYASRTTDADRLADAFRSEGVRAAAVHYRQPPGHNKHAMEAYRRGDLSMLVSVDMLTEGVDATRTAAIINTKEATTLSEMMQMTGRAMRAHASNGPDGPIHKETAINLDLGATSILHGKPETLMALETLGHHGRAETGMRLWKEVATAPRTLAMHRGDSVAFAVEDAAAPAARRWAMYVRDDAPLRGRRADASSRLRRAPTPHASQAEVEAYERDEARARPRSYASREGEATAAKDQGPEASQRQEEAVGRSRLQAMAEEGYRASKAALDILSRSAMGLDVGKPGPPGGHRPGRTPPRGSDAGIG